MNTQLIPTSSASLSSVAFQTHLANGRFRILSPGQQCIYHHYLFIFIFISSICYINLVYHNNITDSSASTTHHPVYPNFIFYGSTQAILTAFWLGSLLC
ncbi:unnamed protein product [Caenorhabditis nigoni]